MMRRNSIVIVFCWLLLLPGIAASTKMKSFWRNPAITESTLHFTKVLVVTTIKHELTRKVAEDKAASLINAGGRAQAIPSYTILEMTDLDDKDRAKAKIEGLGFDGVIVTKYVRSEDSKKYERDENWEAYNYFWGVYYPGAGAVYNAMSTNTHSVFIETMFYSLKDNMLIWAGITETKNPKNPAKVVAEIAEETIKYLQKEGLIAKKKN